MTVITVTYDELMLSHGKTVSPLPPTTTDYSPISHFSARFNSPLQPPQFRTVPDSLTHAIPVSSMGTSGARARRVQFGCAKLGDAPGALLRSIFASQFLLSSHTGVRAVRGQPPCALGRCGQARCSAPTRPGLPSAVLEPSSPWKAVCNGRLQSPSLMDDGIAPIDDVRPQSATGGLWRVASGARRVESEARVSGDDGGDYEPRATRSIQRAVSDEGLSRVLPSCSASLTSCLTR